MPAIPNIRRSPARCALKKAAALHFKRDLGIETDPKNVIVSAGGKQSIFHALMATVSDGEEVIVPAPWWVSYPQIIRFAGGRVVPLITHAKDNFRFSPADLEALIGPRTQWLMLNSPGNPTGAVYPAEMLLGIGEVLRRHPRVMVLSDDIYAPLIYTGAPHATLANLCPDLADRICTVSGVSKSHAMTGFRIGVATGPSWLISAMGRLQSHNSGNPASISQAAAVAAFEGPQEFLADWRERFRKRRDLAVSADQRHTRPLDPDAGRRVLLLHRRCPAGWNASGTTKLWQCICSNTAWRWSPHRPLAARTGSASASLPTRPCWKKRCGESPMPLRNDAGVSAIPILFEDGEALVIDKPGGLPLDPPRAGGVSLANYLDELRLGFQRQPMPVHRLDADTSGCLLLARNPKALKRFSRAFEERQVEKSYLGLVAGELADAEGTIELSLSKISSREEGWRMIPAKDGKPSITHWTRLEVVGGNTLVKFTPVTGRTHQIRIHALAGLGFPLVGDPVYGQPDPRTRRTMLHATGLIMLREGKPPIAATSPLPGDFEAFGITPLQD